MFSPPCLVRRMSESSVAKPELSDAGQDYDSKCTKLFGGREILSPRFMLNNFHSWEI